METNNHELIVLWDEALRRLRQDADRIEEEGRRNNVYTRLLEAAKEKISENDDLKEELDRKQEEIDDLSEQLEQRDQEIADLRQQLLEAQNLHLESEKQQLESEKQQLETEKQQLEAEVNAKPTEIHNHFESGSSAQVFNDKVTGKFTRNQNAKKDKKDKKKRWKKIAGKIL